MPRKALKRMPRTPPKEARNEAWAAIIEALDDVPVPSLASGWAEPAWRSWRNAVQLCVDLWQVNHKPVDGQVLQLVESLRQIANNTTTESAANLYWEIGDWRKDLPRIYLDPPASDALDAAMAIAQLGLSRSDGGGAAFYDRMADLFLVFLNAGKDISDVVLRVRQTDALGANPSVRRVNAFRAAWSIGHYRLAYVV